MSTSSERVFTPRFALVVTAGLCYFMALGILLPVVPVFVKHDLGGNDIAVGVVVGAFAVGAVLIRPFTGRLGDRVGRRILIVVGGVIVGSAGLLYLLASSVVPLVLVRAARRHRRGGVLRRCRVDDHRPGARITTRRSDQLLVDRRLRGTGVRAAARQPPPR